MDEPERDHIDVSAAAIARGGAWAVAGRIGSLLALLLITALVTRVMPPSRVGDYLVIQNNLAFFALLGSTGIGQATIRLVQARQPRERGALVRTSLRAGLVAAVAAAVTYAVVATTVARQAFGPGVVSLTPLVMVGVVLFGAQGLLGECFRAYGDIRGASIFGGAVSLSATSLVLAAASVLHAHLTLPMVVEILFACVAGSVLFSGMLFRRRLAGASAAQGGELGELWDVSWPLWLTAATQFLLVQADVWILRGSTTATATATYVLASKVAALIAMPLMIILLVVPPMLAAVHGRGELLVFEGRLRGLTAVATLVSLVGYCILVVAGTPLLHHAFGEAYASGGTVLLILGAGQLTNVAAGPCGVLLNMTGHHRVFLKISIASCAFAIVTGLAAVRYGNMTTLALSFAAALILQNAATVLIARRRTGIWTTASFPTMVRVGIARLRIPSKDSGATPG